MGRLALFAPQDRAYRGTRKPLVFLVEATSRLKREPFRSAYPHALSRKRPDLDGPEGRRQDGEVAGRQGGEEPVAAGGSFDLGHAPPAIVAGALTSLSRLRPVEGGRYSGGGV